MIFSHITFKSYLRVLSLKLQGFTSHLNHKWSKTEWNVKTSKKKRHKKNFFWLNKIQGFHQNKSENEISRQFPDHNSKTVIIPDYFQTFPDIHSIPDNLARRTNPVIVILKFWNLGESEKIWEKKKIFFEVIQGHLPRNQANSRFSRSPFQIRGHSRFSRSGSNPGYSFLKTSYLTKNPWRFVPSYQETF